MCEKGALHLTPRVYWQLSRQIGCLWPSKNSLISHSSPSHVFNYSSAYGRLCNSGAAILAKKALFLQQHSLQTIQSNHWRCCCSLALARKVPVSSLTQKGSVRRELREERVRLSPIKQTWWQLRLSSRKQSVWTARDFCWLVTFLLLYLVLLFTRGIYGNSHSQREISVRMPINFSCPVSIPLTN